MISTQINNQIFHSKRHANIYHNFNITNKLVSCGKTIIFSNQQVDTPSDICYLSSIMIELMITNKNPGMRQKSTHFMINAVYSTRSEITGRMSFAGFPCRALTSFHLKP